MTTLCDHAVGVLTAADPLEKCRATFLMAEMWESGRLGEIGRAVPPARPARPALPELLPPRLMPKRSYSGLAGRTALVHALAHIELNAIDLACDILCRYPDDHLPKAFYDDWVQVAREEADHFQRLQALLVQLGSSYGELPAHDGLWQAAEKTAHDLLARLAIVPLALEARGLDTTPPTIAKLQRGGDRLTPPVLEVIYHDEIKHVAAGARWFAAICQHRGLDPAAQYRQMLQAYFPGGLKPPFNVEARDIAGMPRQWYDSVTGPTELAP